MGKQIKEIKAKNVFAGPGCYALVAEAVVADMDTGEEVYVTIQEYDGCEYTVAKKSVYAFLAENEGEPVGEFLEEYTDEKAAKKSEYVWVFGILSKLLPALG